MFQSASNIKFKPIVLQTNSNKKYLFSNSNSLYIYNSTDKLYYNYYNSEGNYELNAVKNFPKQNISFSKIDSFNPNGAGDFKSAIIIGTLNFLSLIIR